LVIEGVTILPPTVDFLIQITSTALQLEISADCLF